MKRTITAVALILSTLFFSCKKESVVQKTDIEQYKELDEQITEGILSLTKPEIEILAQKKFEVLTRLKATNPRITIEDIYPDIKKPTTATIMSREFSSCESSYRIARSNCTTAYLISSFFSVGVGALVGAAFPPAGAWVGASGMTTATFNYAVCMNNADNALKNCK